MCQSTIASLETSTELIRPCTPNAEQQRAWERAPVTNPRSPPSLKYLNHPPTPTGPTRTLPRAPKKARTMVPVISLPTIRYIHPEDDSEACSQYTHPHSTPRREHILASVDGSMVFLSRKRVYEAFFPPVQQCVCKGRPCSFCVTLERSRTCDACSLD